jgi:hypothetical protein
VNDRTHAWVRFRRAGPDGRPVSIEDSSSTSESRWPRLVARPARSVRPKSGRGDSRLIDGSRCWPCCVACAGRNHLPRVSSASGGCLDASPARSVGCRAEVSGDDLHVGAATAAARSSRAAGDHRLAIALPFSAP